MLRSVSVLLLVLVAFAHRPIQAVADEQVTNSKAFTLAPIAQSILPKTSLLMQDLVFKGLSEEKLTLEEKGVFHTIMSYWKEDFLRQGKTPDYLEPRGRYQKALKQLFSVIPKEELITRIEGGDLKPLAEYTDEVKADNGNPASRLEQRYGQVNSTLWALYKRTIKTGAPAPLAEGRRIDRSKVHDVNQFVKRFDPALKKLPSFSGHLFRGTAIDLAQASDILTGKIKELFMPAYISTSLDIGDAFDFIRLSKKPTKKLSTLMIIEGSGKLISFRGDFAKEEEILIPRNTKIQIMNAIKVDAGTEDEPWDWMILFCKQQTPQ